MMPSSLLSSAHYLDALPRADKKAISALRARHEALLNTSKKGIVRFREPYQSVAHIRAESCNFSGDTVCIGRQDELGIEDHQKVSQVLRGFMPWRKGPFEVFGTYIDAEWRSDRKWNRLLPELPDLAGGIVADIGCNNGYYMFRMVPYNPRLVVGFDPYLQHYFTFHTLNRFAAQDNLFYEPFGVEDLIHFPDSFDVLFLMGIIYHRSSPLDVFRDILNSLVVGGTVMVESQALPGDREVALFPRERYGKAPGIYFVPTGACLRNWMLRAGFKNVRIFCSHPMSNREQRQTDWMIFESFDDFIDQTNPHLTVEGYPAPVRVFLKGRKE